MDIVKPAAGAGGEPVELGKTSRTNSSKISAGDKGSLRSQD